MNHDFLNDPKNNEMLRSFIGRFGLEVTLDDSKDSFRYTSYSATEYLQRNLYRSYKITIPEQALYELAKMYHDRSEERYLISSNPTIQDAYQKFLMTIALCKPHSVDMTD